MLFAKVMLVAITCPHCRHRGIIQNDMLPRALSCSRCGSRARFERGSSLHANDVLAQHLPRTVQGKSRKRPALGDRAQLPDDLLRALWGEHG